jgi:hypothetical protein
MCDRPDQPAHFASNPELNGKQIKEVNITVDIEIIFVIKLSLIFFSLAPQPSLGLGFLHKIRLNCLEASQQFFLQGRVVSPTPNPHPGGPGLCSYIPQRQGGYPL